MIQSCNFFLNTPKPISFSTVLANKRDENSCSRIIEIFQINTRVEENLFSSFWQVCLLALWPC